eukprot:406843-Rhodomonas_salina.2
MRSLTEITRPLTLYPPPVALERSSPPSSTSKCHFCWHHVRCKAHAGSCPYILHASTRQHQRSSCRRCTLTAETRTGESFGREKGSCCSSHLSIGAENAIAEPSRSRESSSSNDHLHRPRH